MSRLISREEMRQRREQSFDMLAAKLAEDEAAIFASQRAWVARLEGDPNVTEGALRSARQNLASYFGALACKYAGG